MKVEVGLWWVGFFDEEKDVQWSLLFVVKALAPRQPALSGDPSRLRPDRPGVMACMHGARTGIYDWDSRSGLVELCTRAGLLELELNIILRSRSPGLVLAPDSVKRQ